MSSILTNTGAMVALQTMRGINKNLAQTQNEISTGKTISNARDNAAIWSIAKTMESDVSGFKAIGDSLGLAKSTVAVARVAAETVVDLMKEMKNILVAGTGENVDHEKLATDLEVLQNQITSVLEAAQFNGLNLVNGDEDAAFISSLNRDGTGDPDVATIEVAAADLATEIDGTLTVAPTDADTFTTALEDFEADFQLAVAAAASFGAAEKRIDIQAEFVKNLSDAMTSGIGALVDADMEAASAKLQALQVQQQLATQSLSIANQQPQNILSLFR
ncbi:flagellin [Roseinatronobacter sp.]|uniref:flagellin N-terminal helical domain-containing protein n=1 Tax=Roseinatronobacter sp. TaxID=1945755 RepID=UPI0025EA6CFB|nr:flagellin [Rhodobaca sp.]